MKISITFLGGSGELGANSIYLYIDGTGIILDSGLHPKKRNKEAFPDYKILENRPVDVLILTHAHTDHLGSLPYLLKNQNHIKIYATEATCKLAEIMLKDTAKILKSEIVNDYPGEILDLYKNEMLLLICELFEGFKYFQKITITGRQGLGPVYVTFYPSGHILGSAGVLIEYSGKRIFHTSDVRFSDQFVISKAEFPKKHIDFLITEATNAGNEIPELVSESKNLSKYINQIVNLNGSVLIPVFALGKHQEIIKLLSGMMRKNSIPTMNIYTAGLSDKINRVYDIFTYTTPRISPGFEFTDIPQEKIIYEELYSGKYFRESSIVLVPSGMMNEKTLSFNLARKWMKFRNFGIAFVGYIDIDSPAYQLANSEFEKEFMFGSKNSVRKCQIEKFRFSSHSNLEELTSYIVETKPETLIITHGALESCYDLAENVSKYYNPKRLIIPESTFEYILV